MNGRKTTAAILIGILTVLTGIGTSSKVAAATEIIPVIPHPDLGTGTLRSEVAASAVRLKGLVDSFTADSFAAHILYVNGIISKDLLPRTSWARALTRRLDRKGVLKRDLTPKPGDLVFFSIDPATPRSSNSPGITVGVVEKVGKGRVNFVYAGPSKVERGTLAIGSKKTDSKVAETRLTTCRKTQKAAAPGKRSKKGKKARRATKTVAVNMPCKASELLIGFADIETAALVLNHMPAADFVFRITEKESYGRAGSDSAGPVPASVQNGGIRAAGLDPIADTEETVSDEMTVSEDHDDARESAGTQDSRDSVESSDELQESETDAGSPTVGEDTTDETDHDRDEKGAGPSAADERTNEPANDLTGSDDAEKTPRPSHIESNPAWNDDVLDRIINN